MAVACAALFFSNSFLPAYKLYTKVFRTTFSVSASERCLWLQATDTANETEEEQENKEQTHS